MPPRRARMLGALVACAALFAGGYALVRWSMNNGQADGGQADGGQTDAGKAAQPQDAPKHFIGWAKPDFVIFISGQSHGYLQPCGCSDPQYGGLARRYEFLDSLKKKDWHVVPLDLGDVFPKAPDTPTRQNLLKYETAMRALHVMGYHAVGIGKQELSASLLQFVLPQYALNNPRPRTLAANLVGVDADGPYHAMGVRPYEIIDGPGLPKIGVVGIIAKTVESAFANDPNIKFNQLQTRAALKELKDKRTEFNVVLLQSDEQHAPGVESEVEKCVSWCNEQKQAAVNVVIHSNDDPEPPGLPRDVKGTQLITVGHKGKYVGVLGVWRKKDGFETKYDMVLMGPEFAPKHGNPVAKLMEEYAKRVVDQNLVAQFLVTDHKNQVILRNNKIETKYVGSDICANCHAHAHAIWDDAQNKGIKHSKALDTLVDARNPGLRQFDGECLQCHTTGFKHTTGFNDPNIKPKTKQLLHHVGCESCHGPASAHVNNPDDMQVRKLLNPWAKHFNVGVPEQVRLQRIDNFCQDCHNIENDVHWDFKQRWPKVIHMNPPKGGN